MTKNEKKKRTERILRDSRAVRGVERQMHFAGGGTVTQWRGRHQVERNQRLHALRSACRGRQQEE